MQVLFGYSQGGALAALAALAARWSREGLLAGAFASHMALPPRWLNWGHPIRMLLADADDADTTTAQEKRQHRRLGLLSADPSRDPAAAISTGATEAIATGWPRLVALTARVYKGAGHALRDDMLGDAARFLAGCLEEIPS